MSLNQSRAERSESSQNRKPGRSGSSSQQRNFSGGSGKGGGTAPPPSSSSINSSSSYLTSNRSFKKSNNAQGGQSRVTGVSVNSDSNNASAARTLQNGSRLQPPIHGAADSPVKPTTDMATQKSARAVPKAPSSQPAVVSSDTTASTTPAKAPGDTSRSFHLQFGSISPGFMNGMQIPARTNSAPPNLDEQKRDQARHGSSRAVPTFPIPSVPKQQMPRKDGGSGDPSITGEAHQISKAKRDVQFLSVPPVSQTQKSSVHPIPGVSMPMPFHQPQVPVQFGGPNPQIQSQGMTATSLPMPMPMPRGNSPQLQFVPSLQPHPMQSQGILHPGQSLNFAPPMGPQLPHQLGNLAISINQPFTQQQARKFGGPRTPLKTTDPKTHEELRLDRRVDMFMDGGSSGLRSHPNVPQSQAITSVPPHPLNYYPNSYNPNSASLTGPSSVPLTSNQINPSSQEPRFSYAVSQGPQTVSFMSPSARNSSDKNSTLMHGIAEPSSLEHSRDLLNATSSAPSASVQVAVEPTAGSHSEKSAESSRIISLPFVEKGESAKFVQQRNYGGNFRPGQVQNYGVSWNPRAQTHVQYAGEILSGPMQSLGSQGIQRNNPNSDRWQRATSFQKGLMPSPQTPLRVKHKAEKAKQRQLKGILNKLTPQNFEKVFDQVKAVNIDNAGTLTSMVVQIFDKALMEPTFCEMYANFCHRLAGVLPDFNEDNEKITFKRLLLNKCQEEFERGEREQIEADRADEEGEVKQSEGEREEKRIQALRRMLGNIMLIGELYKKRMLTERIMHECIQKLLGQYQNPDEEDIEALCKLMSTIGEMIDHAKAKEHMDAYFDMMTKLSNNVKLSSRVRFMLKDAIDLRKNKWQQRRKVEGSKKIEQCNDLLEITPDVAEALLVSVPAAGSRDKPMLELSRSKRKSARGKKKIKEFVQEADAAGTTPNLYMSCKGPEGQKETVASSESMASTSSINSKLVPIDAQDDVVSSEKGGQSKAEPDDWEMLLTYLLQSWKL